MSGAGSKGGTTNRLIHEKSPYLLQHAHNPVDWYPWGEEAFERARRENKPIFLSIGYSTCHWCHVMARESFEDPEVAALINRTFVPVKVDREERPDIDAVYMRICLALTGSGGWPLTIIMTPDHHPFFAATYVPKRSGFGMKGLLQVIPEVGDLWASQKEELTATARDITNRLRSVSAGGGAPADEEVLIRRTLSEMERRYDPEYGGFDRTPKFPSPHMLLFLLRYHGLTGDAGALEMAEQTLRRIRTGGIFDQVGYGVHRYATDREWRTPHFEKMLYDQALLACAYTEAHAATGDHLYRRCAEEIIEYVLRDLASPDGAFYTAEDAESEGIEGRFYLWDADEVRTIAGTEEGDLYAMAYSLSGGGRDEPRAGANIPFRSGTTPEGGDIAERLEATRQKLFSVRENRVRPHRDEKVLLDWNALMVVALARAARIFSKDEYSEAANRAVRFILSSLRHGDGRLLHRYADGEAAINGMLADHAALVWALAELYQTDFNPDHLQNAVRYADEILERFADPQGGGFYTVAADGEELILREKDLYDGAMPSANSVAVHALLILARLTGSVRYRQAAHEALRVFSDEAGEHPSAYAWLMTALLEERHPTCDLVVAGRSGDRVTEDLIAAFRSLYLPGATVLLKSPESAGRLDTLAPHTAAIEVPAKGGSACLCHGSACELPVSDPADLLRLLGQCAGRES
ncbi:thioredoxin domain-containing protein [Methanofollis fontis]|uniref:Thioredoxin domain-containing protein n=2 Tax=Methanofollis fontis TaxID=2052832 RepID=A0A483CN28_9EURY|nr:thioredoxin domain-containing protein [Methanofollis fontis]